MKKSISLLIVAMIYLGPLLPLASGLRVTHGNIDNLFVTQLVRLSGGALCNTH